MRQILFTLPNVIFILFFIFFYKGQGGGVGGRRVFEQIAPVLTGSIQTL